MKTLNRFLVGFGVLMGSMGFVANAQGPAQAPGQKGGQFHNNAVKVTPPPPRPEMNRQYMGKSSVTPKGGVKRNPEPPRQQTVCKDCMHLSNILGYFFGCNLHNHLHR